jgi:anti-sigma factor RsiW
MNCRTARKRIPDFLNGNLSAAKSHDLERHLEICHKCRRDAEIYRDGLVTMRKPDVAGGMDFTEAEWTAAIRKATADRPVERISPVVRRFRPAFGYALGVLLVGVAVILGIRRFPWLVPTVENQPSAAAAAMARKPEIIEPIDAESVFSDSDLWVRSEQSILDTARPSLVPSPQPAAGDVPSFTWISPDSGLQIVWFVNDNIQLED